MPFEDLWNRLIKYTEPADFADLLSVIISSKTRLENFEEMVRDYAYYIDDKPDDIKKLLKEFDDIEIRIKDIRQRLTSIDMMMGEK